MLEEHYMFSVALQAKSEQNIYHRAVAFESKIDAPESKLLILGSVALNITDERRHYLGKNLWCA